MGGQCIVMWETPASYPGGGGPPFLDPSLSLETKKRAWKLWLISQYMSDIKMTQNLTFWPLVLTFCGPSPKFEGQTFFNPSAWLLLTESLFTDLAIISLHPLFYMYNTILTGTIFCKIPYDW